MEILKLVLSFCLLPPFMSVMTLAWLYMYSSRNMVVITELDEVSLSLVKYWVAICLWRLLKFVISLILLLHDWSSWLWCDIFRICMIGLCKIYHIFLWVIEPNFTQQNTNTFLWPGHSTLNSEWPGASVLWTHVDCIFMKKYYHLKRWFY